MIELSIILVNWNCLKYTEQCLTSIRNTGTDIDYEVIVVDNDSFDAPCQSLVTNYSWATLILSEENLGFGRANNLGVRYSTGKNLLFLNPDTIVKGDALKRMLTALESLPEAGAVGCRLLNPDGTLQATSVQAFPTIANQVFALHWLQRRWPRSPLWGKQALYSSDLSKLHEVDFVSGAAILVKRDVFEKVGGFNPKYFMFAEEADLCLMIHRNGYKVVHTSDAEIIHFGGQSTKSCDDHFASIAMADSIFQFMSRNRGSLYANLYRFALAISSFIRMSVMVCVFPLVLFLGVPYKKQNAVRVFRKWMKIAQWAVRWQRVRSGALKAGPAPTVSIEN